MMAIGLVLVIITGILWMALDLQAGPITITLPTALLNAGGWILVIASIITHAWRVMP